MAIFSGQPACHLVPRTAVSPSPLQSDEVTIISGICACLLVPRTSISPSPLQNFEVAIFGSTRARQFVPGAVLAPSPLQHLEMAITGSILARPFVHGQPPARNSCNNRRLPVPAAYWHFLPSGMAPLANWMSPSERYSRAIWDTGGMWVWSSPSILAIRGKLGYTSFGASNLAKFYA